MFYIYAIKSINRNYIYVGMTDNLSRRFNQHNTEKSRSTRFYAPFKIIHVEESNNRIDARKKEKYLKSGAGKEFLKLKIN